MQINPKITIILPLDANKKPYRASEIYANKKMEHMPTLGIKADLIHVEPTITKS
jgi:hypothetical protein